MIFISKSQGFVSDRDNFDIMHWPFAPLTFKPRFAINHGNKKSPCKKIHCNTNNKQINPQKSKFLFTATIFWSFVDKFLIHCKILTFWSHLIYSTNNKFPACSALVS